MPTTKLLIFTSVWKRPEITEICFMGVNRLRKSGLFPIEAFAVISEESMIPLCEKYDIKWCMYKNEPLGEKKNYGVRQALKLDWDYMIEIGSDDLLYDQYLVEISAHLGKRDFFGIGHLVFLNSVDKACRRVGTRHPFGMGRVISRKLVEKVGDIWDNPRHRGMDNHSYRHIIVKGFPHHQIRTDYPLGVDIKSDVNIWPFKYDLGAEYSIDETLKPLSQQEKDAICSL